MTRWTTLAVLLSFAWGLSSAQARVFNFKDSALAAYVHGSGGLSQLNQDAFANSSGTSSVTGKSNYQYGGELGLMLGLTSTVHIRFGAEVLQHKALSKAPGVSSSGSSLYSLDSTVLVFNPNVAIEYVYGGTGNLRYFAEAGAGYANVTVTNSYKMTAAGTTQLGVSDFDEKMSSNSLSGFLGVGLETLFTDNATFVADMGYRYLPVKKLTYTSAANTIVSPSGVASGAEVTNSDGSARHLNLGGFFAGVMFRFYLN